MWVLDVFPGKKWPEKKCKWWQSNLPADLKEVWNSISINQNALPVREEDVLGKRKRKEQFHGEFLYIMEKNTKTSPGKQQSNLPLALPECQYLLSFHLCWRGERKEKKETKPCECFPIILVSMYYLLLIWHSPSWWMPEEGEGFVIFLVSILLTSTSSTVHQ